MCRFSQRTFIEVGTDPMYVRNLPDVRTGSIVVNDTWSALASYFYVRSGSSRNVHEELDVLSCKFPRLVTFKNSPRAPFTLQNFSIVQNNDFRTIEKFIQRHSKFNDDERVCGDSEHLFAARTTSAFVREAKQ